MSNSRIKNIVWIVSIFLITVVGCNGSPSSKTLGFEWTGKKEMVINPLQDSIPYNEIVNIQDPNLTVKADIDYSTGKTQLIPFSIVNKRTGEILSTQEISIKIESPYYPIVEVKFPDPAILPADSFIFDEYVKVYGKYSRNSSDYSLYLIDQLDLFSGKPGYILYFKDTGLPLQTNEWKPGHYDLVLVANDGYGKSVIKAKIQFDLK